MGRFLAALLSSDDRAADSAVLGMLAGEAALILFTGWDLIAMGRDFNPLAFATAVTGIVGLVALAKGGRDRLSPGATEQPKGGA